MSQLKYLSKIYCPDIEIKNGAIVQYNEFKQINISQWSYEGKNKLFGIGGLLYNISERLQGLSNSFTSARGLNTGSLNNLAGTKSSVPILQLGKPSTEDESASQGILQIPFSILVEGRESNQIAVIIKYFYDKLEELSM